MGSDESFGKFEVTCWLVVPVVTCTSFIWTFPSEVQFFEHLTRIQNLSNSIYSLPSVNELGCHYCCETSQPTYVYLPELLCSGYHWYYCWWRSSSATLVVFLKRWGNELRTYTLQSQLWYTNSGFLRVLKRLFCCMCKMLTMLRDLTYGNGKISLRSQELRLRS